MKICIYSTQIIPTNPHMKQYGGLELIAGLQAKYFAEKGHEVHLFASNQSYQSEKVILHAGGDPGKTNPAEAFNTYWNTEQTKNILKNADIICDHSWGYYPYHVHKELRSICHVHHGPDPGFKQKPPVEKPNFIGVSHSHAKQLTEMSKVTFRGVQNGIDTNDYPFKAEKEEYYLWLGRLFPPKGAHRFITLCDKLQVKGIIAGGSFGDAHDYCAHIKNMIAQSNYVKSYGAIGVDGVSPDGQIGVGISHEEKVKLYQNAKAVVLPVETTQFIEPFGLITPEANSCGTPVIVTPSGGWTETMIHGYNGFHADTDEEFMYYMKHVDEIKPENCQKIGKHFSYQRMGENYLTLFKEINEGRGW